MNSWILLFNGAADIWAAALLRACWQGGLALGLVWAAVRLRPRLLPRVQCWLWRLAYLKLLTAFLWGAPVPLPILPPSAPMPISAAKVASPAASPHRETAQAARALTPLLGPSSTTSRSENSPQPLSLPASQARRTAAVPPLMPIRLTPAACALALWMGFLLWQSARLLTQWRAARRVYRACRPLQDGELITSCALFSHRLGLRQTPWLLAWQGGDTPLVLGAWNPAIVLPEALLADCSLPNLKLMLAHELAHMRRRDLLWAWLPLLARTLFPLHPLVWLGQHELTAAQEMDCDTLALEVSRASVADYGALLLRVAACRRPEARSGLVMVGMAESYHSLKRRLLAMKSMHSVSPLRVGLTGAALLALGVVGIVPWRVAAQTRPAAPPPHHPGVAPSPSGRSTDSTVPAAEGRDSISRDSATSFELSPATDPPTAGQGNGSAIDRNTGESDASGAPLPVFQAPGGEGGQSSVGSGGKGGVSLGATGGQNSSSGGGQSSFSASGQSGGKGGGASSFSTSSGGGQGASNLDKPLQATAGKYTIILDRTALVNVEGGSGSAEVMVNGVRFKPNLEVSLRVTAANRLDLQQLAGLSPQALALELSGAEAAKSPATRSDPLLPFGDEIRGTLYLRLADPNAKNLRTLEGALLLNEGKRTRVELSENDLKAGAQKRVGDMTLKVEAFHSDADGVQVDLTVTRPAPRRDAFAMARDPQLMQEMLLQSIPGIEAELRDSGEHSYSPIAMSAGSGSGDSSSASSSSFSSNSSFSSSSSSSNGENSSRLGGNSEHSQSSRNSHNGDGMERQTLHLTFPAPDNGAAPIALSLTLVNRTGKTQRIPFKFTNVPLP